MSNNYNIYDEGFIARWMSNELNTEEMKAFEEHPEYSVYKKMKQASDQLSFLDFDKEKAFDRLSAETSNKTIELHPKKANSIWKFVLSGVAAAILLLFGVFFSSKDTTYKIGNGEQLTIQLPDDSKVLLNAASDLSFNEKHWSTDRDVNLKGEGYFKVAKGKQFTVHTDLGKVQVLGTQFTVNTLGDTFIVKCFEGKVGITTSGGDYKEITKGMALQINEKEFDAWKFEDSEPSWVVSNTSSFRKIAVSDVLIALKRQYDVDIEGLDALNKSSLFTGSFPNYNLEKALKVIFGTMDVKYTLDGKSKIVLLKK